MASAEHGLVYYLLDADRRSLRLKIGTTTSLRSRINSISGQTFNRQIPLLLAVEAGGYTLEGAMHERHASLRLTGEWFRYEGPLRDYVATLDHPYAYISDRPELWCFADGWCGLPSSTKPTTSSLAEADIEKWVVDPAIPVDF